MKNPYSQPKGRQTSKSSQVHRLVALCGMMEEVEGFPSDLPNYIQSCLLINEFSPAAIVFDTVGQLGRGVQVIFSVVHWLQNCLNGSHWGTFKATEQPMLTSGLYGCLCKGHLGMQGYCLMSRLESAVCGKGTG